MVYAPSTGGPKRETGKGKIPQSTGIGGFSDDIKVMREEKIWRIRDEQKGAEIIRGEALLALLRGSWFFEQHLK